MSAIEINRVFEDVRLTSQGSVRVSSGRANVMLTNAQKSAESFSLILNPKPVGCAKLRLSKRDAADLAEAERRLADPKRVVISLRDLRHKLGL